jgi:GTP-binding protein
VFDLFAALDATDEQLDFPILYGSAKRGLDGREPGRAEGPPRAAVRPGAASTCPAGGRRRGRSACSAPSWRRTPSSAASITGRITSGSVKPNQAFKVLSRDGNLVETGPHLQGARLPRHRAQPVEEAEAGDIVAIAGLSKGTVADTFCDPSVDAPIQAQPIDPPTVTMQLHRQRLAARRHRGRQGDEPRDPRPPAQGGGGQRRAEDRRRAADKDSFFVSGRGELQLAILIETMRREGFELAVSRPRVVFQKGENGEVLEPIEEVLIDVDEEHSGVVVQKMSERKAEMIEMRPSGGNRLRLVFHAPTRGLIGYQSELLTDTRGTAIMNRLFKAYEPHKGEIAGRINGVLISNDIGEAWPTRCGTSRTAAR